MGRVGAASSSMCVARVVAAAWRTRGANPRSAGHSEAFQEQIVALYFERPSMRGIQRATGVSRQTLSGWLKKRHVDAAGESTLSGANAVARPER